ncbi:alpha/beta hydrolase [Hymenobacter sp. BRD128]|uniref:alpha/beta fold hydrolase n=1 Tax=Hymenobacter sp. BRD128 TaxID=2675878 RepID=UPI0015670B07|nr:alpha/beta hydrolase [Hymenobacter sp. BRD128]QKG58135.1 alpha/beta hydrolase [Hymenobacter sp. BRD128]
MPDPSGSTPDMLGRPVPLTVRLPDGRRLGLTRYGDPSHPVAVFHHGFGSSSLELPPAPVLLASLGLQVLALDRPGVGQSDVYRRHTFATFAAETVAVLDALGIAGPVGVLGWSVGGVHAQALAALYPARVAAVHLLSTCLPLGEPACYQHLSPTWKFLRWGQLGFPWLNRTTFLWLSRQWARHPDRTIAGFICLLRPAERRVTQEFRALLRDAARQGFAHAGRGVYDDAQAWCRPPGFRIEAIRAPTTLWHGAADGVWAPSNIPYLASRIVGARLHLLPGQGHMLYLENWAEILTQLRAEMPA